MEKDLIFVSHAANERKIAEKLMEITQKSFLGKIRSFISSRPGDIGTEKAWIEEIQKNLKDAKAMLLLCSPESVQRPWVNYEAGFGRGMDKNVISVYYSGLNIDAMKDSPFPHFQMISLEEPDGFTHLYHEIAKILDFEIPQVPAEEIIKFHEIVKDVESRRPVSPPNDAFFRNEKINDDYLSKMIQNAKELLFINTVSLGIMGNIHDRLCENRSNLDIRLVQYDESDEETLKEFIDIHRNDDLNFERLKQQFANDRLYFTESGGITELQKYHKVSVGKIKTIMPISFIAVDYLPKGGSSGIVKAQHHGYKVPNKECAQMIATYDRTPKLYNFYVNQIEELWGEARWNS